MTARDAHGKFISRETMIERAVHEQAEPIGMNDNHPKIAPRASRAVINRTTAAALGFGFIVFFTVIICGALWFAMHS